jgi:hypothetical protein
MSIRRLDRQPCSRRAHSGQPLRPLPSLAGSQADDCDQLMGCLAIWRRSLRPGIVTHAWADVFGGLIVKRLPYN